VASAAERGDQVFDAARLVFGGGLLRLDGLDEVLTQTDPGGRLPGRQLGVSAGDVKPLPSVAPGPCAAVSISSS
jgi:hypothetical protein